jgi:heme/copper-type cytochrome/quinol oxidase subunit 2
MITVLVICWTFMSFMLVGWAIKYERNRKKSNNKKDNRKLLKD